MKNSSLPSDAAGLTIFELLLVMGLVTLIAGISVPAYQNMQERARKAKCMTNIRQIHTALTSYVQDVGHWPQMEAEKADFTEEEFFGFWIVATEPYGLSQEHWVCPSDRSMERRMNEEEQEYFGSYVVTRFDDKGQTPFRWNQPWLMERANFHGKGAHMLMPDGSVQESDNPFYGR